MTSGASGRELEGRQRESHGAKRQKRRKQSMRVKKMRFQKAIEEMAPLALHHRNEASPPVLTPAEPHHKSLPGPFQARWLWCCFISLRLLHSGPMYHRADHSRQPGPEAPIQSALICLECFHRLSTRNTMIIRARHMAQRHQNGANCHDAADQLDCPSSAPATHRNDAVSLLDAVLW